MKKESFFEKKHEKHFHEVKNVPFNKMLSVLFVVFVFIFSSCQKEEQDEILQEKEKSPLQLITFEDLHLPPDTFHMVKDASFFVSNGVVFNNYYDDTYGDYWEGFVYSSMRDSSTAGYGNQYSSYAGIGAGESNTYGVFHQNFVGTHYIVFETQVNPEHVYVTNTTYTALSMKHGDDFAKKFGGEDGNDKDWYKLEIRAYDADTVETSSVEFYLADYRFEDNDQNYIIKEWTKVDLSELGNVRLISFHLSSSDVGEWGINTPTYCALDNLQYIIAD